MSAQSTCQFLSWVHGVARAENLELTLTVVAEGHLGLAEANGVFALGDAIELLEFSLVNAL
jgi:hypothetical protein